MSSTSSKPSSSQQNRHVLVDVLDVIPQVNWESFQDAGVLTPLEKQRLEDVRMHTHLFEQLKDGLPLDLTVLNRLVSTVSNNIDEYIELCVKLLFAVQNDDAIRNVLHLTGLLMDNSPKFLKNFHEFAMKNETESFSTHHNAYTAFLRLLNRENRFIVEKCLQCLTRLFVLRLKYAISGGPERYQSFRLEHLSNYIDNLVTHLQQGSYTDNTISALMELLKYDECRILFYRARGIPHLISQMRRNMANVQTLYDVGFCLWMLSFGVKNYDIRQAQLTAASDNLSEENGMDKRQSGNVTPMDIFSHENIIPRLHDVLRNTQKEKVIRVVLGTFRNLAQTHRQFITDIIHVSVPKTLSNLMKRNFEDRDIHDDLNKLVTLLDQYIEDISSFDEYRQEVLSGRLQWTPVHESEKFWKENLNKFEEDNFFIIRELIKLLSADPTWDHTPAQASSTQEKGKTQIAMQSAQVDLPQVADEKEHILNLTIACHDLGQFVRYFPRGKRVLIHLEAKPKILVLMEHPNDEVRKHALLCTQKLMIQNWSMLQ